MTSRCTFTLNHLPLVKHPELTDFTAMKGTRCRDCEELSGGKLTACHTKLTSHSCSHCSKGCCLPVRAAHLGSNSFLLLCICALPELNIQAGVCTLSPVNSLLPSLPSFCWAVVQGRFFPTQRCLCKVPAYSVL